MRSQRDEVISSAEELVIWIPVALLKYACSTDELGMHVQDSVLKNGLWWPKQTASGAAKQWVAIYDAADRQERRIVMAVLQARVSTTMLGTQVLAP